MTKIYKGIKKDIEVWKQVPYHIITHGDGWKIWINFLPEISHNDIIEYEDSTSEIFKEIYDTEFFYATYTGHDMVEWAIDLTWKWYYDEEEEDFIEGNYRLLINRQDPKFGVSPLLEWLVVITLDKNLILDIINGVIKCIENNDTKGLQEIKDKYHVQNPNVDEEEYWKDPAGYWKKVSANNPFQQDKIIGYDIWQIVKEMDEAFIRKRYRTILNCINRIESHASAIEPHNPDLAKQIFALVEDVDLYLTETHINQGKDWEEKITEEQREYIKEKLEPMRKYLYDKYA